APRESTPSRAAGTDGDGAVVPPGRIDRSRRAAARRLRTSRKPPYHAASHHPNRGGPCMNMVLVRNWWALALRGALAILFGLLAFYNPAITLAAIILLYGAYALVDGVFAIVAGLRAAQRHERWWPFALEGLVSIVIGLITFALPGLTAFALLLLVSAWAIVSGVFRIAAAGRLGKEMEGEWLLILNGLLSVVFGVIIMVFPGAGLVTLVWLIGVYAIIFGIILLALAFRLRGHHAKLGARPAGAR